MLRKIISALLAILFLLAILSLIIGCADDGENVLEVTQDGAVYTASRYFTVSALNAPAVYAYPRKSIIDGTEKKIAVKSRGIPACVSMKLVVSGAQVVSAVSKLSQAPDAIVLTNGNTINLGLGPDDRPIEGDVEILELTIQTATIADSANLEISECIVRDSTRSDIALNMTRGCLLVR